MRWVGANSRRVSRDSVIFMVANQSVQTVPGVDQ